MVFGRQRSVKTRLRNWVVRYFYSGWQPAAFCFGLLAVTGVLSWDVRLSLLVGNTVRDRIYRSAGGNQLEPG